MPFTSGALDRAKRSLLSLMHEVSSSSTANSTVHISHDEDNQNIHSPGPVKKRCLWDNFEKGLKQKQAKDQLNAADKDEHKLSLYLGYPITLTEKKTHCNGGIDTKLSSQL